MSIYSKKPELAWVPVAKCQVRGEYQRSLTGSRSRTMISNIVLNFDWKAFQTLTAARDGDVYWIIDGQHRLEALKRLGETSAPAIVFEDLDLSAQAKTFASSNDRVAVSQYALHRARVVGQDKNALAIDAVCLAAGIKIRDGNSNSLGTLKPGETAALGVIKKIIKVYGTKDAVIVLKSITDIYRNEPRWLTATFFTVASVMLAGKRDTLEAAADLFSAKMRAVDPVQLYAKALALSVERDCSTVDAVIHCLDKMASEKMPKHLTKPKGDVFFVDESDQIDRVKSGLDAPVKVAPVTYNFELTPTQRFEKLVRTGATPSRLAAIFDISIEEATRRAREIDRRTGA